MKKLFSLTMMVLLTVFVSSCNNDDDGESYSNNTEDAIVGTWLISEIETSFTSEDFNDSVTVPTSVCSEDYIFTFAANGDLTVNYIEIDFEEALAGNLELACEDNGVSNGSWESTIVNSYIISIDGDALPATVNFSNDNNTVEIIAINDQTDDPFDPFTQTIIFRGDRN